MISDNEKQTLQNIFNKFSKKKNILDGVTMKNLANLINLDLTLVNTAEMYDFNQLLELITKHRTKQLSKTTVTHLELINIIEQKLDHQSGLLLDDLLKNKTNPLNGVEAIEIINLFIKLG